MTPQVNLQGTDMELSLNRGGSVTKSARWRHRVVILSFWSCEGVWRSPYRNNAAWGANLAPGNSWVYSTVQPTIQDSSDMREGAWSVLRSFVLLGIQSNQRCMAMLYLKPKQRRQRNTKGIRKVGFLILLLGVCFTGRCPRDWKNCLPPLHQKRSLTLDDIKELENLSHFGGMQLSWKVSLLLSLISCNCLVGLEIF